MLLGARTGIIITALAIAACGGASPAPDAGGGGGDDAGPPADTGTPRYPTHDCEEADFVDRTSGDGMTRTIAATADNTYDVPCMTIRVGQSVTWATDFTLHPLGAGVAPGHRGETTTPTPIEPQTTGTTYSASFPTAGEYAFYCSSHYHTSGMYGVIRVVP